MHRVSLSILWTIFALGFFNFAAAQTPDAGWLPATPDNLPRWRGFNLLNKFMVGGNTPFDEADFRMIHGWGFNFVRIPMDYRIWITNGDWTRINEDAAFRDLDQAVAWGEKYHVHICLNFHRAPGYTVADPPEARSLWTDPEAQRVCAMHWAAFARHFKGISSERLSFNLFNEPPKIDGQTYAKVVALVAAAIRAEDPNRLIICDGLQWGNVPVPELIPLHVAQSLHDYAPIEVTHYHASWISGSSNWPLPTWPLFGGVPGLLYGPEKPEFQSPLTLKRAFNDTFPTGTRLTLKVGTVSNRGHLVVRADNQVIFEKAFVSGPVAKEGEKIVYKPEYKCYQNVFAQNERVTLTNAASEIAISNDDGDWMTLASLTVQVAPDKPIFPLPLSAEWGQKPPTMIFQPDVANQPWSGGGQWIDREWIYEHEIAPWRRLGNQGVGVMVGEWGCFNQTPYDVTLRWMEDTLTHFKTMGWGWAMWNLKGSFGILDSDRPGAVYQDFEGHKLDTRMLQLLQEN